MTQPSLLDLVTPETYTERVAALFQSKPGIWIDGLEIAAIGGAYAWRTRLSEARRQFGLTITNRQRRIGKRIISEYRWEGQAVR
jgi:hypothetical protein